MRELVFHTVLGKLTLDGLICSSGSVSFGISALDHEAVDDAVEGQSVVKTALSQFQEIGYCDRSGIPVQLCLDGSALMVP